MNVTDVLRMSAAFRPAASLVSDLRASLFAPSILWYRLKPRSEGPGPRYLNKPLSIDYAELFFVARDGRVRRTEFGTLVPYENRHLPTLTNTLGLPAGAMSEGALYLRVATREAIFGGFSLRPPVDEQRPVVRVRKRASYPSSRSWTSSAAWRSSTRSCAGRSGSESILVCGRDELFRVP